MSILTFFVQFEKMETLIFEIKDFEERGARNGNARVLSLRCCLGFLFGGKLNRDRCSRWYDKNRSGYSNDWYRGIDRQADRQRRQTLHASEWRHGSRQED